MAGWLLLRWLDRPPKWRLTSALQPIPDKLVVLTFDDSKASHYTVVRPLLKKYGFGATFFITEGFTFRTNKEDYLTWEQIGELHREGFEIGNHTRDHKGVSKDNLAEAARSRSRRSTRSVPPTAFPRRSRLRTPAMRSSRARFRSWKNSGSALHAAAALRNTRTKKATASHTNLVAIIRCCCPRQVMHVRSGRSRISSAPVAGEQREDCDSAVSWCARCRTSLGAHTARTIRGVHEIPPR